MTLRPCLYRFVFGACFLYFCIGISAQESSSVPQQSPSTQAPEQDPLQRPLTRRQQNQSQREKEDKHYQDWKKSVKWIITDEELAAFNKLATNEERDNFIEIFWKRRDPTPDTEENEYKEEFYRRKAYANEHFSAGIPGELTDRGHMYILYGPPDSIDSHPMGGPILRPPEEGSGTTETFPFEIWRYRHLEGRGEDVTIEFVDVCGCGEYRKTVDRSLKDALKNVPNAGLTDFEAMRLSSKADRIRDPEGLGRGPFNQNNGTKELERIEQDALLESPPALRPPTSDVTHILRYNMLSFDARVDFVKATADTVLVPITVKVPNRELTFVKKDGMQRGIVNIFGRMTTLNGTIAQTFEDTVRLDLPLDTPQQMVNNSALYWKALPMRPGRYRLDIVVKDINGDKLGSLSRAVVVPAYEPDKLAVSSLILADVLERVTASEIGGGNFVIGASKVRPKVEDGGKPVRFQRDHPLDLWLQVYNLSVDEKTGKPAAAVQYEVVRRGTNEPVVTIAETLAETASPGSQLTLQKHISLAALAPGEYQVTVKIDDLLSRQSIAPRAVFAIE